MEVSYVTKTELGQFLHQNGNNIEAGVRSALIDSLEDSGVFHDGGEDGTRGWLEYGPFPGGPVPSTIQILDVSSSTTVETNANLKAIIMDDAGGQVLNVSGDDHHDVFVAMGKGSDSVNLVDNGNDTVYGGRSDDAIRGGDGNSSLFGGAGNDSIYAGQGDSTLVGGAGNDFLEDQWGHSTLSGGGGNDTLMGVQGTHFEGGGGQDEFWLSDGGAPGANSTLQGGNSNDTFHIGTHTGNDTIIGGNGNDTVDFTDRSFFDVHIDADASTNTYMLEFTDGQTVSVRGVEELHFTDANVHLPKI
jgi:Ca2+-binding RTX toxin-like protein